MAQGSPRLVATAMDIGEPDLVVVHVLPTQNRRTARATGRERNVCIVKGHALRRYEVARVRHVGQVILAHVVGEDEDEVGFGWGRLGRWRRALDNGPKE